MGIRRRWPIRLAAVVAALGMLLVLQGGRLRTWLRPPTPDLPDVSEIAEMRAAVWANGSRGYYDTNLSEFVVPPQFADRIWRRFDGAEHVRDPQIIAGEPLGEVVVTTHGGAVVRIAFYEVGPEWLVFTRDGTHYFRAAPKGEAGRPLGGGLTLGGTLRHLAVTASRSGVDAGAQVNAR